MQAIKRWLDRMQRVQAEITRPNSQIPDNLRTKIIGSYFGSMLNILGCFFFSMTEIKKMKSNPLKRYTINTAPIAATLLASFAFTGYLLYCANQAQKYIPETILIQNQLQNTTVANNFPSITANK